MNQEIRIPVGLDEKTVSISVDPETGRTAVRIDGKMAGRPLTPDEDSREIRVGDDLYLLKREWERFELEYIGPAAPVVQARSAVPAKASIAKKSTFPTGKIILGLLLTVVAGWLYGPIAEVAVDWNRFMAPDNTFRADMPGEVVEAKLGSFARAAGAKAWLAERNDKIFEVGYVDVPSDVKQDWENEFINSVRDSIAKKYKGQVVNDKDWPGGTELMISCQEWRDTPDGPKVPRDVRIRLIIRDHRVVVAAASAPPREIMSMTVTRFFMSVKV